MKRLLFSFVLIFTATLQVFGYSVKDDIPDSWSFSNDYSTHYSTSYSGTFQKGVKYLQILLSEDLGIYVSVDGGFGNGTKSAVIKFQKKYGLTPDGIVGRNTKKKLDVVLADLKGNATNWKTVKPVPLSPGNAGEGNYQVINTTTPTLRWQKVDGAPKYWIAIKDLDTGEQVFSPKLILPGNTLSYKVPAGKLKKGHRYFWDLATVDTNGNVVQWTENKNPDRRRFFRVSSEDNKANLEIRKDDIFIPPLYLKVGDTITISLHTIYNTGNINVKEAYVKFYYGTTRNNMTLFSTNYSYKNINPRDSVTVNMNAFVKLENKIGKHYIKVCVASHDSDGPNDNYCVTKTIDVHSGECNVGNYLSIPLVGRGIALGDIKLNVNSQLREKLALVKAEAVLANDIYTEKKDNKCGFIIYDAKGYYAQLLDYIETGSGLNAGLYRDASGRYILAFGGTNAKEGKSSFSIKDIFTDLWLLDKEIYPVQLIDAEKYITFLKDKFPDISVNNMTLTGHSLGGGIAQFISAKYGYKAITFNTAPFPYSREIKIENVNNGKITNFMANNDPLTLMLKGMEEIANGASDTNAPNMDKFADYFNKLIEENKVLSSAVASGVFMSAILSEITSLEFDKSPNSHASKLASALIALRYGYYNNFLNLTIEFLDYSGRTDFPKKFITEERELVPTGTEHGIKDFINATFYTRNTQQFIIDYINSNTKGTPPDTPSYLGFVTQKESNPKYTTISNSNKQYRKLSSLQNNSVYITNTLTPILKFSRFVDKDDGNHTATWFDVRKDSDRKFLYDSGWMKGDVTQAQVPPGYLEYNTKYRVRIVYQDSQGKLSKIGYGYFKTAKAPQLDIKNTKTLLIGQTGAFIDTEINLHNSDNIKGFVEYHKVNDDYMYYTNYKTLDKNSKFFYQDINNLECGTSYKYRVVLRDENYKFSYGDYKTFTTLACGGQVELSVNGDEKQILDFGNVKVGECATKNITVTKMDNNYVVDDKLNFISVTAANKDFSIENPQYHLIQKGEKEIIKVKFCPTKAHNSISIVSTRNGVMSLDKYNQIIVLQGKGVESDGGSDGNNGNNDDLYFTEVTADKTTVKAGEQVRLYAKEKYHGNRKGEVANYIGYFLSKDTKYDPSKDIYLGEDIGKPDAKFGSGKRETVTIPNTISSGRYYILFVADYKDQYNEGEDEDNNVKYVQINVKASNAPGGDTGGNDNIDTDGDGISDSIEEKYGFDPYNGQDAFQDADGDGVNNIDEIKSGTDPNNKNDYTSKNNKSILSEADVSKLYVAIFNRASEGKGNRYWQTQGSMKEVANLMLNTKDAKEYFGDHLNDNQAFIEWIYKNTLNKEYYQDPDGIAYWTNELNKGLTRGEVVVNLINAIDSYKNTTDEITKRAYNQFINRVKVSNYMAEHVYNVPSNYKITTGFAYDLYVGSKTEDVNAALELIDSLAETEEY